MSSPTHRTLAMLKKDGWMPAVVEKWNPHARIRQDLFGIIDVLALKGEETLAVQVTSWTNVAARIKKIRDHENVGAVRDANWRIEVHGWRKNKKGRWECKIVDVS